jgi:hypothetical protein
MSDAITNNNIMIVQKMIELKKSNKPFITANNYASTIINDYDNFPYTRWFRGVYNSERPIIAEREAGWRIRNDSCYNYVNEKKESMNFSHCFEYPCSTVFPCKNTKEVSQECLNFYR